MNTLRYQAIALGCAMLTALASPAWGSAEAGTQRRERTFTNPVDLPYRYQKNTFPEQWRNRYIPYREAADPTLVWFKGRYWLFASHSLGYWSSADLQHWNFVGTSDYDTAAYAPTVVVMDGKMYLASSDRAPKIWMSDDPASGRWRAVADIPGYFDPCLFLDDDQRLYLYEGLSPTKPLHVMELDKKTFQPLRSADIAQSRDTERRGWEVPGDHNELNKVPTYIEGSWVNKHNGKYYLQYSAPGTQYMTYADGILTSPDPMGPFSYEDYSPFSSKPTGFITSAGHSSTMQGPDKRWWRMSTMSISKRHNFERRVGLFPSWFTPTGELVADTYLGDYPHYLDGKRELTGWMLLSRGRPATASSSLDKMPPALGNDENIRSWWSARSGDAGEWYQIDLGGVKRIEAVQINFADQDSKGLDISQDSYRYRLQISSDGAHWRTAVDHATAGRDAPHDYQVLPSAQNARFVRLVNVHSPDGGKFSLYDLRVFGRGQGSKPHAVASAAAQRGASDQRKAMVTWQPAFGAEFYIVRIGIRPDLLIQNYQVYDGQTSLTVPSLNSGAAYFYAVDAVNENGITRGPVLPVTPSR